MQTDIVVALISASTAVMVAVLGILQARASAARKAEDERTERRARIRAEESRLSIELMSANCKLTVGCAMAIKRGHANGEIEDGLAAVAAAQDKYIDFERRITAEELNRR